MNQPSVGKMLTNMDQPNKGEDVEEKVQREPHYKKDLKSMTCKHKDREVGRGMGGGRDKWAGNTAASEEEVG